MEFYGDFCGKEWFPDDALSTTSMSTAIARIYTQEGFVVAADGRKLNGKTGEIAGDEVQKIFPLRHAFCDVACSIAGVAQLVSRLGLFDFGLETSRAALAIALAEVDSLDKYSESLRTNLSQMLEVFNRASLSSFTEAQTHIYLDGYFLGRPFRRKITLTYQAKKVESVCSEEELVPGRTRGYGSPIIMALLSPNIAPQFQTQAAGYLRPYRPRCKKSDTLPEAIDAALATIQAHCDPEALTIDRKVCEAVGGHIHAVTITPQHGCRWVSGFEPITL